MDSLFNRFIALPLLTGNTRLDILNLHTYLVNLADYFTSYAPEVTYQTGVASAIMPFPERNWPDSSATSINYYTLVSDGYAGGDFTVKLARRSPVATSGTAAMDFTAFRIRDNTAEFIVLAQTSINFVVSDTNTHVVTMTIPGANIVKGDILRFRITRDGAHASDTVTNDIAREGLVVSYPIHIGLT